MRRGRLTYTGAFHHGMNRGHEGKMIFAGNDAKEHFLEIMADAGKKLKIRILAYCVMGSHYHLVIQNSSGRMADFFKRLNGEFAIAYRARYGGRGYVFQDRYHSTIIQDEGYLLMAISYVLGNPVRARLISDFRDYAWSSARIYFSGNEFNWIDHAFVEELYGSLDGMRAHVCDWQGLKAELPIIHSEWGPILASESGVGVLNECCDRRSGQESLERRRHDDFCFEPIAKIFQEFYGVNRIGKDDLDVRTRRGQRLRLELLVQLKERGGLTYREIAGLDEFSDVKLSALAGMYRYGTIRGKVK